MVSRVRETDCTARNCDRRAVTSAGVNPAEISLSKPRGAGVVVEWDGCCDWEVDVGKREEPWRGFVDL